jgi:hypothetical protein
MEALVATNMTLKNTLEILAERLAQRPDRPSQQVSVSMWDLAWAMTGHPELEQTPAEVLYAGFAILRANFTPRPPVRLICVLDELGPLVPQKPARPITKYAILMLWMRVIEVLEEEARCAQDGQRSKWAAYVDTWSTGLTILQRALPKYRMRASDPTDDLHLAPIRPYQDEEDEEDEAEMDSGPGLAL